MKTTIDLPPDILHHAKVVAAQRQTTLKELILQGLAYAVRVNPQAAELERKEKASRLIAAFNRGRNVQPVGRLRRNTIYDRHLPASGK